MKRILIWFFTNLGYSALLYYALVTNNSIAGNFVVVVPWLQAVVEALLILAYLPLLASDGIRDRALEKLEKSGKKKLTFPTRRIPAWLSHIVGAGFILALIAAGWWVTAVAWIFSEILEALLFITLSECEKRMNSPQPAAADVVSAEIL